jgi:hypothetical protein
MQKVEDYRRHAEECRTLARGVTGDQREQFLKMAETWDALATERSRQNNLVQAKEYSKA